MTDTILLLEGADPADVTADFLGDVRDSADAHGLAVEGISVLREGRGER